MWQQILPAFRITVIFTVLTGLIYPAVVTGFCKILFPRQASGSLITSHGVVIGSSLIGQSFTRPEYFHPRPSAAGNGYDATASQGSNFGPANRKLVDRVKASLEKFRQENPNYAGPVPADLLTASASGLDPDISPASAEAQIPRVASARGASAAAIQTLVDAHIEGRDLGFLGEPRVNVLELNLALDRQFPPASRHTP